MKLEYLYLDGYKSLKKVSLSFKEQESSASVNFLIGQNGSGKSSLLEAVGLIFQELCRKKYLDLSLKSDIVCQMERLFKLCQIYKKRWMENLE